MRIRQIQRERWNSDRLRATKDYIRKVGACFVVCLTVALEMSTYFVACHEVTRTK